MNCFRIITSKELTVAFSTSLSSEFYITERPNRNDFKILKIYTKHFSFNQNKKITNENKCSYSNHA